MKESDMKKEMKLVVSIVCAVLGGLTVLMMWKAPAEQVQET